MTAVVALATSLVWLRIMRARPALAVDARGVELRGLGQIGWNEIVSARWVEETRPESGMTWFPNWIELDLDGPVLARTGLLGRLASLMGFTIWLAPEPGTLRIQINTLEDEAEDVRGAFNCFLEKPIRGA